MLARPTARRGVWADPLSRASVETYFRKVKSQLALPFVLEFRLARYLSSLASAFALLMWGVPSTPESIFNTVFSLVCDNVTWPHCEAVCKRISAFAGLCECGTVEG